jgi:hypothetical protein
VPSTWTTPGDCAHLGVQSKVMVMKRAADLGPVEAAVAPSGVLGERGRGEGHELGALQRSLSQSFTEGSVVW